MKWLLFIFLASCSELPVDKQFHPVDRDRTKSDKIEHRLNKIVRRRN
jgi:hypothetical protein